MPVPGLLRNPLFKDGSSSDVEFDARGDLSGLAVRGSLAEDARGGTDIGSPRIRAGDETGSLASQLALLLLHGIWLVNPGGGWGVCYLLGSVQGDILSFEDIYRGGDFDGIGTGDEGGESSQVEIVFLGVRGTRVGDQPVLRDLVNALVVDAFL